MNPFGSGCNVRTQDPENFDEEVKSLVTAWWNLILYALSSSPGISFLDEVKNGNTIVSILTVQHLSYTSASITRKKPFISAGEEEMVEEDVVQKDAFDHKTELTLERLTATMSLTSVSLFGGGRVSEM